MKNTITNIIGFSEANNNVNDALAKLSALDRSMAVIEFNMDGIIINANENFLNAVGYTLPEIQGQHHRIFVSAEERESNEYRHFWDNLRQGKYQSSEYRRITKNGDNIWIQASYNPILDKKGKPVKVVKFATDITQQKTQNADFQGQIKAISKSQAVIEFNMDGTIINANENFLGATGYSLDEIKGQHHRLFMPPEDADSSEYKKFWDDLRQGKYQSAEYRRVDKKGNDIWIQASYNPIFDLSGKPFKVVKYATDITRQVQAKQNAGKMIESAAVGTEELSASVKEITESMTKSRAIAEEAYGNVEEADRQPSWKRPPLLWAGLSS